MLRLQQLNVDFQTTTTMTPAVADEEASSEVSAVSDEKDDDVNNKHVLRQAQLSRELQELNAMLADKQELAGQMMRNDKQLESVKLQYEVSTVYLCTSQFVYLLCLM